MCKNNDEKILSIGSTTKEVRRKQNDLNPGKAIADIFCRGKNIPDDELSDSLRDTINGVRELLMQDKIMEVDFSEGKDE